jgi:hypothetical protein
MEKACVLQLFLVLNFVTNYMQIHYTATRCESDFLTRTQIYIDWIRTRQKRSHILSVSDYDAHFEELKM